jgi:hypothetical protein
MSTFYKQFQIRRSRSADKNRTARFARKLGVTPDGLEQLARAVAGDGTVRGGMARMKLVEQGYAAGDVRSQITDAGREIVRRAREMGW